MTPPRTRPAGWAVGHLAGVPVHIGRSWFLVAAVIVLLFGPVAQRAMPSLGGWAYVVAATFAVLLLLSVLVHEAAHGGVFFAHRQLHAQPVGLAGAGRGGRFGLDNGQVNHFQLTVSS